MIIDVIMPKMGESLQEGTITKWLKKIGEKVERDEMILEISTDKVDTEVPSPASGILVKILAKENETIEVGKVIAQIETETENVALEAEEKLDKDLTIKDEQMTKVSENKEEVKKDNATLGEIFDVVMPKMGESLQEGTITKWLKKVGDRVERDEMILEISTDKVDTEVPSPVSGVLIEILYEANQTIEVGKTIARISTSGTIQSSAKEIESQPKTIEEEPHTAIEIETKDIDKSQKTVKFLSPVVKTIAKEEKISNEELESITGTGADGRITKKDALDYIEKRRARKDIVLEKQKVVTEQKAAPIIEVKVSEPIEVKAVKHGDEIEVIQMDRIRQLIAEHMVYSKQTSPHVTSVGEADVTSIVKFRNKIQNEFQQREGFKLTYTPFFAKATTDALKAFPLVNVSVEGKNIIKHKRIHLGFATALNDGNLIVPVIKNADVLNLIGFARAIYDLSTRARNKKLNPDDIQGATFSITNVGTFGTLFGTPIINQPNTGIMGIGAIQKRPVVREINGEYLVVIRDMVYVSITYDHRVIDGMLAGQWLLTLIKSLEGMDENELKSQF